MPDFLQRLAAHRVLDRLARLDEAGEAEYMPGAKCRPRPSRHRSRVTASMIATGSVRGKCSVPQAGADALVAAGAHLASAGRICRRSGGWRASASRLAPCASAPSAVGVDQALHVDRAVVDGLDGLGQGFGFAARPARRATGPPVGGAEQHGIVEVRPERRCVRQLEIARRDAVAVDFSRMRPPPIRIRRARWIGERLVGRIVGRGSRTAGR